MSVVSRSPAFLEGYARSEQRPSVHVCEAIGLLCPVSLIDCRGEHGPLIQLCSMATDVSVLGNAAHALRVMARHEGSRPLLIAKGAVLALMQLCTKSADVRVLGNAAAALANLALPPCLSACLPA
jgi:hypothetical protein